MDGDGDHVLRLDAESSLRSSYLSSYLATNQFFLGLRRFDRADPLRGLCNIDVVDFDLAKLLALCPQVTLEMKDLLLKEIAEHIPGCNMAFWKWVLDDIGGFQPVYRAAGDDVDICWRLQARGYRIGFAPSAQDVHVAPDSPPSMWQLKLRTFEEMALQVVPSAGSPRAPQGQRFIAATS